MLRRERLQACSDTAAYMFKEAAADMALDEVRKLKRDQLQESSCVLNVSSCAVIMNTFFSL